MLCVCSSGCVLAALQAGTPRKLGQGAAGRPWTIAMEYVLLPGTNCSSTSNSDKMCAIKMQSADVQLSTSAAQRQQHSVRPPVQADLSRCGQHACRLVWRMLPEQGREQTLEHKLYLDLEGLPA